VDRLEALTFEITTRNQQSENRLGLWLTALFGAIEAGAVAASVATWYYANKCVCCARLDGRCDVRNGASDRRLVAVEDEAMNTGNRAAA
jgi:hypothetical protein